MKRYQKYSKYWYPHIVTMIRLYPNGLGDSQKAEEAKNAISNTISKTIRTNDGIQKMQAINSIYFTDAKTTSGVSSDLYVSKRTVEKWVHEFVYDVATELGYISKKN